jgi:hypothetical protein
MQHRRPNRVFLLAGALAGIFFWRDIAAAAPLAANPPVPIATYADLADLADSAPLVIQAQLRKMTQVEPERARGVRPGWGRFYVEAKTTALLAGDSVMGEALRYLADLPLDARGKGPKLNKRLVLLFARTVPGRPGELQLVAPDAQLLWDAPGEARLRTILGELLTPGTPPRITGISEAIHVPGTLAGEGETQMFLTTRDGSAASITVTRRSDTGPVWGVSFSEALESGHPPARESLRWYRLACFLPARLPLRANLSETARDKAVADSDYRFVLNQLGPCPRNRR